jgi:hypothetical protein
MRSLPMLSSAVRQVAKHLLMMRRSAVVAL